MGWVRAALCSAVLGTREKKKGIGWGWVRAVLLTLSCARVLQEEV